MVIENYGRESKGVVCKLKTIVGRYFKKEITTEITDDKKDKGKLHIIECGSVFSSDGKAERLFIVFSVWKVTGNKRPL